MTIRYILLSAAIAASLVSRASDYDAAISQIEHNSLALASARSEAEAARAVLHGENTIEGPEAGFDYLWGNKYAAGNRMNFSLSQGVDFPTVYHKRRSMIKSDDRNVELRYEVIRRDVLMQARSKCIEVIYYNRMIAFFTRHLAHTLALADLYHNLMERGQATVLESGKAALAVADVKAQKARVEINRTTVMAALQAMNGGMAIELADTVFPVFNLPADENTYCAEALANAPEASLAAGEAVSASKSVGVERALTLPKLSMGYTGEKLGQELMQGVSVGVALPLWSNSAKIRAAKAAETSARLQEMDVRTETECRLRAIYNNAVSSNVVAREYEQAIEATQYSRWLGKALELRNISVTDYIRELGVMCSAIEALEQARRDAADANAQAASYLINE